MTDFTPPGYMRLSEMLRENDRETVRGKLFTGEFRGFRYDERDGRLLEIGKGDWASRPAAKWLQQGRWTAKTGSYEYRARISYPILVKLPSAVDEEPINVSPDAVYLSPFMKIMLAAIEHHQIGVDRFPKKETLVEYFQAQKLPDGTTISPSQAAHMATFCRPFEAMRGGQKRVG